jgi:segregation and condensation protein B
MEEPGTSPQGASPEPEPTAPVENPSAGAAPRETSQPEDPAVAAPAENAQPEPSLSVDELMATSELPFDDTPVPVSQEDSQLKAILEAIVYVAEEPLTLAQIAASLQQPTERIQELLDQLIAEFDQPGHGVSIREVAGGYKMATKPEHHEAVRNFVKSLKPPLKLSLPALETLAVIAYKQPATGPEIMEIRGVQGGGVLKTLLDRKLIAVAGRKNVIGKPMLYKTTKEFLIQFGLKDLSELPSLKEFEEIRRMAFSDSDAPAQEAAAHEAAEPGAAITPAATTYGAAEEAPAEATEPVAEPVAEPIAEPIPELAAELIAEPPAAEPTEVAPAVEAVPKTLEATLEAPPESAPVAPAEDSAPHEEI